MNSKRFSFRRGVLLMFVGLPLAASAVDLSLAKQKEIETLVKKDSILVLQQAMEQGALTAESLTAFFLRRIETEDKSINAVIAVNQMALETARQLDEERLSGGSRGPMHGIPILIKDNIETSELPTTAGSLALAQNMTGRDAPVIARLRQAGAIILGKTNLSEWANFRSTRSSSGWSAVGGQTHNPHDLSRSPCGSSSGSGAAVAAYLAIAALGTETDGSVICPAAVNGVVGIKPSVGLVSRTHIVPISHSQDTAGPMTHSVSDAAILLTAMQGYDSLDQSTASGKHSFQKIYVDGLDASSLKGKRIGVLRSAMGFHEGVDAVMLQAIDVLKSQGVVIIDDLAFTPYQDFSEDTFNILLYEFKHNLNAYLRGLPSELNKHTLESLIDFNERHAETELIYFQQEIFNLAQQKGPLTDEAYKKSLQNAQQATRQNGIDKLLKQHHLDALIAPTLGAAWTIDLINGDHFTAGGISSYPAVSGYPHITIPMGKLHGMPLGISFTASAFSEQMLFSLAYAFEQNRP